MKALFVLFAVLSLSSFGQTHKISKSTSLLDLRSGSWESKKNDYLYINADIKTSKRLLIKGNNGCILMQSLEDVPVAVDMSSGDRVMYRLDKVEFSLNKLNIKMHHGFNFLYKLMGKSYPVNIEIECFNKEISDYRDIEINEIINDLGYLISFERPKQ